MQSPFDGSTLTKKQEYIYSDAAQGILITDVPQLKARFEGAVQKLQTREMKLDTLGIFPLTKEAQPLLSRKLTYEGSELTVPELFIKSQIPIYASTKSHLAYISAEGTSICRYFYELWKHEEQEISENDIVLAGFAILASYAGL